MSQVLITSDLHLGHRTAAENRGFSPTEAGIARHDVHVIEALRAQLGKNSVLWVLGDVAMKADTLTLLAALPGRKRLVMGNHDQFPLAAYTAVFEGIHGLVRYKEMWLSHCPIHPQEMYRVKLNVHGHIHKGAATKPLPLPYFNVNWDFWGRAVDLDEIKAVRDAVLP